MKHTFMRLGCALLVFTAATLVHAQQKVTKITEATEEGIADALDIGVEPDTAASGALRGIRPTTRESAPGRKAAGPGRSNLLITFATNSAELTAESKQALTTVARALQSDKLAGFAFSIEGHADPRGQSEANLKLSEARAKSVVDYLVTTHNILPDRLLAVGKGSSELLNADKPDAAENRRVTIVTKRQ